MLMSRGISGEMEWALSNFGADNDFIDLFGVYPSADALEYDLPSPLTLQAATTLDTAECVAPVPSSTATLTPPYTSAAPAADVVTPSSPCVSLSALDSRRIRQRKLDANRRVREGAAIERIRAALKDVNGEASAPVDRVTTLDAAAAAINALKKKLTAMERAAMTEPAGKRARYEDEANSDRRRQEDDASRVSVVSYSFPRDDFLLELLLNATILQVVYDVDSGVCLFHNRLLRAKRTDLRCRSLVPRASVLGKEAARCITSHPNIIRHADGTVEEKPTLSQPLAVMALFKRLYAQQIDAVETVVLAYDLSGEISPLSVRAWLSTSQRPQPQIETAIAETVTKTATTVTYLHLICDIRSLMAQSQ